MSLIQRCKIANGEHLAESRGESRCSEVPNNTAVAEHLFTPAPRTYITPTTHLPG